MELFTQLFGDLLAFVYHCFDRIVIYGYLRRAVAGPSRWCTSSVRIVGVSMVSKEILSQRTADYQNWVEAFARNHRLPIQWAEKGRAQGRPCPALANAAWARDDAYGVYFIFKSMEQGPSFRVSVPQICHQGSEFTGSSPANAGRFTHYYFYLRDENPGPDGDCGWPRFFPRFQTTYYLNGHSFIEQETEPRARIGFRKTDAFLAVADVAALQAAADKPEARQSSANGSTTGTLILGPKFLRQRAQAAQSLTLLCDRPDRVLPQLHLQAQLFPSTKLFENAAANSACGG